MDPLDWLGIAASLFFPLFFAWWILDVMVRSFFRRVDRKAGSLALEKTEEEREGERA